MTVKNGRFLYNILHVHVSLFSNLKYHFFPTVYMYMYVFVKRLRLTLLLLFSFFFFFFFFGGGGWCRNREIRII